MENPDYLTFKVDLIVKEKCLLIGSNPLYDFVMDLKSQDIELTITDISAIRINGIWFEKSRDNDYYDSLEKHIGMKD